MEIDQSNVRDFAQHVTRINQAVSHLNTLIRQTHNPDIQSISDTARLAADELSYVLMICDWMEQEQGSTPWKR